MIGPLVRPLADLAAWTGHFRRAEIPVLGETIEALDALRANEERTDANSIGEMIGGDPLMTLKVLAYVSDHRGRSVVTGAETVIAALVMMGIPPFFRAFAAPTSVENRLAASPEAGQAGHSGTPSCNARQDAPLRLAMKGSLWAPP